MSIIRQRSKNLIFSGLIGFISGLIVVLMVYMVGIRGNVKVIEWILNDSQLEVMTMSEPVDEPVIAKEKVVRLKTSLLKDSIITEDMLETVEVEASNVPTNHIRDIQKLIGEKTLIDLEPLTTMTKSMTERTNVYQVSFETLEIQNVHYPDILAIGQCINMRIHYPTGQDYTILENKNIIHIDPINKSFFVDLTEEEILSYSSAIEDKNIYPGTQLYITIEGNGKITLMDASQHLVSAYKNGLTYDSYPLNPNVLALSQVKNFDTILLDERVVLDLSLKEFFDLNSERFSYEIKLQEKDESVEAETLEDPASAKIDVDIQDENIVLESTAKGDAKSDTSEDKEIIQNEEVVEVDETTRETDQPDFDF